MEDFEFGHMDSKNRMWWIACGGALVGMATAFSIAWVTETCVADQCRRPADLRLVAEPDHHLRADDARRNSDNRDDADRHGSLPGRGEKLYDPAVTDGQILVGVENPAAESVEAYERALSAPPGAVVKKI